jgi:hypothetical protein
MTRLLPAAALAAIALALGGAPAGAETFILDDGEAIEGFAISAVGGVISIKLPARGMRQLPLSAIRRIEIPVASGAPVVGRLLAWSAGTYEVLADDRMIRLRDGRILAEQAEDAADHGVGGPEVAVATAPAAATAARARATRAPTLAGRVAPVSEQAAAAILELSLSAPAAGPVIVIYATIDGSATDGRDYRRTAGTLRIEPGSQAAQLEIPLIHDQEAEEDEQFDLFMSSAPDLIPADGRWLTVTIQDDD